jgi:hypothetical protein
MDKGEYCDPDHICHVCTSLLVPCKERKLTIDFTSGAEHITIFNRGRDLIGEGIRAETEDAIRI